MNLCVVQLLLLYEYVQGTFYIYSDIDTEILEMAHSVGQQAKIDYISDSIGINDPKRRHDLYLDGLEKCNNIGSEHKSRMIARAEAESRPKDVELLVRIGLKRFNAQFITVPAQFMREITHMACSKHEEQLQCGAIFEGDEVTRRRIDDLKTIGNHKLMFEYECVDKEFVPRTYPCIGSNVAFWTANCAKEIEEYATVREEVNVKIISIYEAGLESVKALKTTISKQTLYNFVFSDVLRTIAGLEGKKCVKFKKMRKCILPALAERCGDAAANALDTSISLGYLRTERKERLQLDFDNLNFPTDPRCSGL